MSGPPHPDPGLTISAVLPAYNEEALVERTVTEIAATLRGLARWFEIVVTDDGSRDQTGAILVRLASTRPELHLRVVTHHTNRCYGAALASGFGAASADLIWMLDADGQFAVGEIVELLAAVDDDIDLVIGYRARRADPPSRKLNAWGWNLLVNSLFGYTARDVDCALKLFRRSVWQSLTVRSSGAAFSAELLVRARRLGFRIRELPVSHLPRTAGTPTGAAPHVIARARVELFQLRLKLAREPSRAVRVARGAPTALAT